MLYVQSLLFCFGRLACFQVHEFPFSFLFLENYDLQILITFWRVFLNWEAFLIWKKPLAKEESSLLLCGHISPISGAFSVFKQAGMYPSYPCTEKSWELLAPLLAYTDSRVFTWYTSLLRSPWLMINKHSAKGSVKSIVLYFCILF